MKRIFSIFILAALCLCLCACGGAVSTEQETVTIENAVTSAPTVEETAEKTVANVMVLNGTTGFGMAKLISDASTGGAALDYNFSVESDASVVTAALINGSCDIAALPTNAAATVYSKTEGGVQMLAINTLGVLYVVVNTENVAVESLDDLAGMTVYAPAQNPTFLFQAILSAAEIEDVTIDNTYAQPADLRTALAAGEVDIAVLPEPMVTIACAANEALSPVLDLTAEWDAVYPAGSLVQGCIVARTEYIDQNPEAIELFLEEYEASIAYLTQGEDAGALIEETGVFTNGAVAQKAIPNCNVCFLAGADMMTAMNSFSEILFEVQPAAIGGAVPGNDFYYIG